MTQPTGLAENNRLKRYARSLGIVVPRRGSTTDVMRRFIRTYFADAAATASNTAAEARRVRTVEAAAAVVEPLRGNSSADSNDAIPAFRPVEAPVTTQFRGEPVAISKRENANFMLTTMQYSASAVLKEESALDRKSVV